MSFWGSFTGSDQRKDLRRAQAKATGHIDQGYGDAQNYMEQAYGEFEPFSNGQDYDVYRHAIGLGTADERTAAQDRYFSDPAYQRMMDQNQNSMLRHLNARGASAGGQAALAGARIANEGYQGWLDRLSGVGQNAMTAANARAGIRTGQGELAWGRGTTLAGNAIQHGNSMAQSRGILSNNLLKIAEIGVNAMTGGMKSK